MNREKRNAILSLTFYVVAVIAAILINVSGQFKSGPCTPGQTHINLFKENSF